MLAVRTGINIRTQLMELQLCYIVEKTVKSKKLKEVIEESLRLKALERLLIFGYEGNDMHAKMTISIDYDKASSGINIKTKLEGKVFGDSSVASQDNNDYSQSANCPVWEEATNWFMKLCEEQKLSVNWGVRFCSNDDELTEKFNLKILTHSDKTETQKDHVLPHSNLSEMTCGFGFSKEKFGDI